MFFFHVLFQILGWYCKLLDLHVFMIDIVFYDWHCYFTKIDHINMYEVEQRLEVCKSACMQRLGLFDPDH